MPGPPNRNPYLTLAAALRAASLRPDAATVGPLLALAAGTVEQLYAQVVALQARPTPQPPDPTPTPAQPVSAARGWW